MTLLGRVTDLLDRARTPYALIGAAALAAHGVARSTYDLDLLTVDPRVLDAERWGSLTDATIDIRTGDADDPLAGAVRFRRTDERPVDLIVGRPAWQREVIERARPLPVADTTLPVVTASDLILLKLYAGGSQDAWDVAQLLAGDDRDALVGEVEGRLSPLPPNARDLWRRALG